MAAAAPPQQQAAGDSGAAGAAGGLDKQIKALSKKVRQCQALVDRQAGGEALSQQEAEKVAKMAAWWIPLARASCTTVHAGSELSVQRTSVHAP